MSLVPSTRSFTTGLYHLALNASPKIRESVFEGGGWLCRERMDNIERTVGKRHQVDPRGTREAWYFFPGVEGSGCWSSAQGSMDWMLWFRLA